MPNNLKKPQLLACPYLWGGMVARLGHPLYTVACHDDLTAADLVGQHLIGDNGAYWNDGTLLCAVCESAICYLDEIVETRKDTTVVLHLLIDDCCILPLERTGINTPAGLCRCLQNYPGRAL